MTRLAHIGDVRKLDLGFFVHPAVETGTGAPRVEAVYGYLVAYPELIVIFDTGIGAADAETESHYQPHRRRLDLACRDVGWAIDATDVVVVVNSHLHCDHCGGNPVLAGRPIVVQSAELEAAREASSPYTFPELADFDGAIYDRIDGEAELADGLVVLPTPDHSPGHQSLIVRTQDGTLLVAGQAMDFSTTTPGPVGGCASAYASAHLARRASHQLARPVTPWPDWLDRIEQLGPARVIFTHDGATIAPEIAIDR